MAAYFSKTGTGFFQLQLLVLIFALDRTNYARWQPVHIKDMNTLPPAIKDQSKKNWVFHKAKRPFSAMPLDQTHRSKTMKK